MSVNLFRVFEDQELKEARQTTEDLKLIVMMAKKEQDAAEDKLRETIKAAKERLPVAGSLVWRGRRNV